MDKSQCIAVNQCEDLAYLSSRQQGPERWRQAVLAVTRPLAWQKGLPQLRVAIEVR